MRTAVIILSFVYSTAWCQTLHNNTSIFISKATSVYVSDVSNNGFIMNNGSMHVSGDWANTHIYQGNGTIALEGTDQFVDNNDQSIEDMIVDGGGRKTIRSEIGISGTLHLHNGILQTGSNGTLSISSRADIQGGSSISFVNGPLVSRGTGYRFFPIGVNQRYYPVWFTNIRGIDPVIEVEVLDEKSTIQTTVPVEMTSPVLWTRKVIDGRFQGSEITAVIPSVPQDESRVVFIEGDDTSEQFTIVENDRLFSEGGQDVASSKEMITKGMFTIGTLPEEPARPAFLSTTLSANASDVVNRVIKMQGVDLVDDGFFFEVYNRWGNQLFETSSLNYMSGTGWDGKQNGQQLPAGAYPYRVVYRDRTGGETQQTGFITIVY
jgi:gliding motility-associated-like protein